MARITQTFTTNQTWTVPDNVYLLEVFMVGGGGGGGGGGGNGAGGGGGGGQVVLTRNVQVTPGQSIGITIGAGGAGGAVGSVGLSGSSTIFGSLSAVGGNPGGVAGTSGGSTSRSILGIPETFTGGPNGGGGAGGSGSSSTKIGSNGYLFGSVRYAPGGGGGIDTFTRFTPRPIVPFLGGVDGGGKGSAEDNPDTPQVDSPAEAGLPNTGGGGGGGAASGESTSPVWVNIPSNNPNNQTAYLTSPATAGAAGGSGIVIVSYEEATFDLSTSSPGVAEGSSITVNLSTKNVWNGASFDYSITGDQITSSDFVPASLTGSITISNVDGELTGSGSAVITLSLDAFTESVTEKVTVSLDNGRAVTSFLAGDFSQSPLTDVESKIISTADYNAIQSKVQKVLGSSSLTFPDYGWGQIVQSAPVNESTRVRVTDWNNLRNDIINSWVHLYNTTPTLVSAIENRLVRANISNSPYAQYDAYANVLIANRFGYNPSQSAVSVKASSDTSWPGAFGPFWNTRIFSVVLATWPDAQSARQFFNSGGEIRILSSRVGGSVTPQNLSWTSLLSSSGSRSFGGSVPQNDLEPNDGLNYYRLRNTFDIFYQNTSSTPYSSNVYRISARSPGVADNSTGTALSIEFLIEWIDDYQASGGAQDQIDGTISVQISTLEAIGSLAPTGTGNFSVISPTVTVSTAPRP
jgi:hypothetical protein